MTGSGRVSAILSALCMGLGQLNNRQYIKGFLLLVLHLCGLYFVITILPHNLWGLITLGDEPDHLKKVGRVYVNIRGDHSIFLMVQGIISVIAALIYLFVYYVNIRDAYLIGRSKAAGVRPNRFSETIKYMTSTKFPLLVLTIPLLLVLFFTVMPILFMTLLAFTNFSFPNFLPPKELVDWTGFKAFLDMFKIKTWSDTFYGVALWTLIWTVLATLTTFIGGFGVALLVQMRGIRFKGFWRTLFILPYAIPQFISLLIMRNMFNGQFGPINQYLNVFGLGKLPWLTDPFWAKLTVIVVNVWIGFPITMLMIIGLLSTIPKDLYEAAEIDGASRFQQFMRITFPSIMFSFAPLLVMSFAGNINNFNIIFLLTEGNPANAGYQFAGDTDILITWLYNLTLKNGKYNFASVVGLFIFIAVATASIWNIRRTKAFREEDLHA